MPSARESLYRALKVIGDALGSPTARSLLAARLSQEAGTSSTQRRLVLDQLLEQVSVGPIYVVVDELLDDLTAAVRLLLSSALLQAQEKRADPVAVTDAFATIDGLSQPQERAASFRLAYASLHALRRDFARTGEPHANLALSATVTSQQQLSPTEENLARVGSLDVASILVGTARRLASEELPPLYDGVINLLPPGFAQAIVGLAPQLSSHRDESWASQFLDQAWAETMEIDSPLFRSRALSGLAEVAAGRQRNAMVAQALDAVSLIERSDSRAVELSRIAPFTPSEQVSRVVELAHSITPPKSRQRAARALAQAGIPTDILARLPSLEVESTARGSHQVRDAGSGLLSRSTVPRLAPLARSRTALADALLREMLADVQQGLRADDSINQLEHSKISTVPRLGEGTEDAHAQHDVSLGFSERRSPFDGIMSTLPARRRLYLWLEIGERVIGAIPDSHPNIDLGQVPDSGVLDVVVFSDGLIRLAGKRSGQLLVGNDRVVQVLRAAATVRPRKDEPLRRLFFSLTTPDSPGIYEVRCNIYHRGCLLQSRRVKVPVATADVVPTVSTDYVLTSDFTASALASIAPHRLSLFVNASPNGTHDFRFFGEDDWSSSVKFSPDEISTMVRRVRGALRRASWDSPDEWTGVTDAYRYTNRDFQRLETDLISLAIAGFRMWDHIQNRLGRGPRGGRHLRELMRAPGQIQLAPKESPEVIPPIAGLYDYPLDTGARATLRLCSDARQALSTDGIDLATQPCFQGLCPSYDDRHVVCPGGFWGFRHDIGVPITLPTESDERQTVRTTIATGGATDILIGASTDPALNRRRAHVIQMIDGLDQRALRHRYTEDRDQLFALIQERAPHILYLYCHGGLDDEMPFVTIGPVDAPRILRDTLGVFNLELFDEGCLVFLNGCHTTSVSPEEAVTLVAGFVEHGASGVIGTEITVFEPLATTFAEQFMSRFVIHGDTIGAAIRRARLVELQQACNPLGLIYVPFAMASLVLS